MAMFRGQINLIELIKLISLIIQSSLIGWDCSPIPPDPPPIFHHSLIKCLCHSILLSSRCCISSSFLVLCNGIHVKYTQPLIYSGAIWTHQNDRHSCFNSHLVFTHTFNPALHLIWWPKRGGTIPHQWKCGSCLLLFTAQYSLGHLLV